MSYSPQIKGDLVRRLYQLKQIEKRPMTRLVNEAVTEYLEKKEKEDGKERFIRNDSWANRKILREIFGGKKWKDGSP